MPAGFLSSTRPVQADAQAATAGVKRGKRDMDSKQDATLLKLQALWDDTNNKVYEELEERLVLTESDVRTVRTLFGDSATVPFNGVKLWQWILSKRNIDKPSVQLRLQKDIESRRIPAEASAADVVDALDFIETNWQKVKKLDQTALAAIKHALQMFDGGHPQFMYVMAMQAQLDCTGGGWSSFGAFKTQLVEHINMCQEQRELQQLRTGMATAPQGDSENRFGRNRDRKEPGTVRFPPQELD